MQDTLAIITQDHSDKMILGYKVCYYMKTLLLNQTQTFHSHAISSFYVILLSTMAIRVKILCM